MIVELVNTGTELMLGRTLNTHQQWLCRELADLGYVVSRQVAIPDTAQAVQLAVREALSRADLVITTGGLGPTSDDLTREAIADLLGKKLHEDPAVLAQIQQYFISRNRAPGPRARVQAMVPEDSIVLANQNGTAPGLAMEVRPNPHRANGKSSWLIMLPGPPRELRPMFKDALLPLLGRVLPTTEPYVCLTLRTTGIGESQVERSVAPALAACLDAGLELGYCAHIGQVDVRLSASGSEADAIVSEAERIVRSEIGPFIYGEKDEDLEATVIRLLTTRKETLTVAESCTGGCLSHRLTNVPGASHVFLSGVVTYSNKSKQRLLGVKGSSIEEHGAVSELVAREMAEGARAKTRATYALSLTGIAGPSGGTEAKPVGTVFIGLAWGGETLVEHQVYPFDRLTFKQVAAQQAMELLRRVMQKRQAEND